MASSRTFGDSVDAATRGWRNASQRLVTTVQNYSQTIALPKQQAQQRQQDQEIFNRRLTSGNSRLRVVQVRNMSCMCLGSGLMVNILFFQPLLLHRLIASMGLILSKFSLEAKNSRSHISQFPLGTTVMLSEHDLNITILQLPEYLLRLFDFFVTKHLP